MRVFQQNIFVHNAKKRTMLTPEEVKNMLRNPAAADWSKIKAEDITFSMGKPMTEEQMRAYCQANGIQQANIIKKPDGDCRK